MRISRRALRLISSSRSVTPVGCLDDLLGAVDHVADEHPGDHLHVALLHSLELRDARQEHGQLADEQLQLVLDGGAHRGRPPEPLAGDEGEVLAIVLDGSDEDVGRRVDEVVDDVRVALGATDHVAAAS